MTLECAHWQLTDTNRPDILNTASGGETAFYDRMLTVEVWYPARLASGQQPGGQYSTITRNPGYYGDLTWTSCERCGAIADHG